MIKAAFWISVIVITLPFMTGGSDGMPEDYDPEPVRLEEVAFMVQTTARDVMRLCDREPDACDTGQRILWNTRVAASDLAGRAHDWLSQDTESSEEQES